MCGKCSDNNQDVDSHSLLWGMMKELSAANKRMTMFIVMITLLWFGTIGMFIWYLYQYDFTSETTNTISQDGEGFNNINQGTQGGLTLGAVDKNSYSNQPSEKERPSQGNSQTQDKASLDKEVIPLENARYEKSP